MKTLLTGILLGFGSVALAQIQKGQMLTSGTVGLSFGSLRTASNSAGTGQAQQRYASYGINSALNRGWFVRDGLFLGYQLGVGYINTSGNDAVDSRPATYQSGTSNSNITLGASLRKYWPVTGQLYVYLGGGLSVQSNSLSTRYQDLTNTGSPDATDRVSSLVVAPAGQGGAMYQFSNRLALELSLTSNAIPVSVNTAKIGLVILSGQTAGGAPFPATQSFKAPQTGEGRWLLGASAQVTSLSNEDAPPNTQLSRTSRYANAGVSAGRFIRNNVLAGLSVDYSANRLGTQQAPGPVSYSIEFTPFVRTYIGTNRLRPYWQAQANYGVSKPTLSADIAYTQAGAGLSVGLAYLVGNRIIIQTSLASLKATYVWAHMSSDATGFSNVNVGLSATTFSNFSVFYAL